MSRPTLYITRLLPEPVMAALRERYSLVPEPVEHQIPTADDLRRGFTQADAVICTLADPITDELLAAAPRLKIVANYAVGYNNIDVAAATRRGIVVTNTPDVLTDATADLTWALILAVARRVVEGDQWARSGTWPGWAPTQMLGTDVTGKTLGIIGCGNIGSIVADRAIGLKMKVIAFDPFLSQERAVQLGVEKVELDDLIKRADFITLHTPLTEKTKNIIDADAIKRMKKGVRIVNCARGGLVDEVALYDALKSGHVAGAALDVFSTEPLPGESPLWDMENVIVTPHHGGFHDEYAQKALPTIIENFKHFMAGDIAGMINRVKI